MKCNSGKYEAFPLIKLKEMIREEMVHKGKHFKAEEVD